MSTKPTNGSKNDGSRNAKKRKRQTSGLQSSTKKSPVYDLWVPVPKDTPLLHTQEMQQRLASTGFTHMALTHTVFGAPKQSEDKAENAIPDSLFNMSSCRDQKKLRGAVSTDDASSREKNSNQQSPIKVLRRLHAVLENLSDVGHYVKRRNEADAGAGSNKSAKILQEYDLVSLAPRNDATFQSACSSANASDIITLDYTSGRGGVQLPFRIRPADVKAVIARKAVFEIPYAPAILNRNQRKGLVQTW